MTAASSGDEPAAPTGRATGRPRSAAEAALLARVFGDPLPQTTSDERRPDGAPTESPDEWLRSQVPPHHA